MVITLTESYINNTMVYAADIQLSSVALLKAGLAEDSFGRNVTEATSAIASRVGAILAVNGDFYGFRDSGYVIRNGVMYRETKKDNDAEDLVLWPDGSMEIIREGDITAAELYEKGALQVYSFGPGLIQNGEITVTASSEVTQSKTSNPRTAIGMISPLHYVMVVSDGRTTESRGLSLLELANVMKDLGCIQAYNLDGGGSTTMYFNGEVINNPTTGGSRTKERSVSDIVYIGY
ncbi:MAG: phosphodiester glycosidase family protein [Eubacterium sp.]|nr:phosphodiester glycosidase family protein [Eubacterium sp.]